MALGCDMITLTAFLGYFAASLVFATFCTKRMISLRSLAIGSNIAFIGYGYLGELWPILILHAALLPLNVHRLRQAVLLDRPNDAVGRRQWKGGVLAVVRHGIHAH
jgi:hypothetical protein